MLGAFWGDRRGSDAAGRGRLLGLCVLNLRRVYFFRGLFPCQICGAFIFS